MNFFNRKNKKKPQHNYAQILHSTLAQSESHSSWAALVTVDGLMLAISGISEDRQQDIVSAMTAGIYSMGTRSAKEYQTGQLQYNLIAAENAHIITIPLDDEHILTIAFGKVKSLDNILTVTREIADNIREQLGTS